MRNTKTGKKNPVSNAPEAIKHIRANLGKTQLEFAEMLGISVRTVQNWEIGRRAPTGPTLALLLIAAREPQALVRALR